MVKREHVFHPHSSPQPTLHQSLSLLHLSKCYIILSAAQNKNLEVIYQYFPLSPPPLKTQVLPALKYILN